MSSPGQGQPIEHMLYHRWSCAGSCEPSEFQTNSDKFRKFRWSCAGSCEPSEFHTNSDGSQLPAQLHLYKTGFSKCGKKMFVWSTKFALKGNFKICIVPPQRHWSVRACWQVFIMFDELFIPAWPEDHINRLTLIRQPVLGTTGMSNDLQGLILKGFKYWNTYLWSQF